MTRLEHYGSGGRAVSGRPLKVAAVIGLLGAILLVMLVQGVLSFLPAGGYRDPSGAAIARWVMFGIAAVLSGVLIAMLTFLFGGGLRSVARYTLIQCLRMKMAIVFIVLLAAAIIGTYYLPGDGTLGGRIRSFLSYSTSLTGVLLAMMTVLLGATVISGDMKDRQIFTLSTKPLARWEYVVGRWLGIVVLDAVLLTVAVVAIYALSQHLRSYVNSPEVPFPDKRTVETEVFVARRRVAPDPPPIEKMVKDRMAELEEDKLWAPRIEAFMVRDNVDRRRAEELSVEALRKEIRDERGKVRPGQRGTFTFSQVDVRGSAIETAGKVTRWSEKLQAMRVEIPPQQTPHISLAAPVFINGVKGRAVWLEQDSVDVQFRNTEDFSQLKMDGVAVDSPVEVRVVPVVQFRYRLRRGPEKGIQEEAFRGEWVLIDPESRLGSGTGQITLPLYSKQTVTLSAAVVSSTGVTEAVFTNYSPGIVVASPEDLSVMYPVASFESNYVRGTLLIFVWLAFWAAVAVMAGCFLQFSVACLLSFTLTTVAIIMDFLIEAAKRPQSGPLIFMAHWMMRLMRVLLPSLSAYTPGESYTEGLVIPWSDFGESAVITMAFRTVTVLLVAFAIFHRREVARVQV